MGSSLVLRVKIMGNQKRSKTIKNNYLMRNKKRQKKVNWSQTLSIGTTTGRVSSRKVNDSSLR